MAAERARAARVADAEGLRERAARELDRERRCDARDEAVAAFYGGQRMASAPSPDPEPTPALAETLRALLVPWTSEELEAARAPWPHAFRTGETGLFPAGEVTVLASTGREGKTTVLVGACAAFIAGHSLGGLRLLPDRSVIVYSAEDSRTQYARKVAAQTAQWSTQTAGQLMRHLLVPDLDAPGFLAARALVAVLDGAPIPTGTERVIVETVRPLLDGPTPPGLLVFETASTLSEAEETNPGFRALVLALRFIARELQLPVVLSHHVSQASLTNLAQLNLSTADIRGGTVLVNNARQTALLVNLGSPADPFPETDARTLLRDLVCPGVAERVTALVCLDSSKGVTPPPIFFRWMTTDWGPAAVEVEPPVRLTGLPWRKLLTMVNAQRSERQEEAKVQRKAATKAENVRKVVDAVAHLQQDNPGQPISARRVRERAGMSSTVVNSALVQAEREGLLRVAPCTNRGKASSAYCLAGQATDGDSRESG